MELQESILNPSQVWHQENKPHKDQGKEWKEDYPDLEKVSKAEGYLIYRQDSSDSKFYQIGTVKSGSTLTYTDTVKSNNKTYTYKVQAYNTNNGRQGVGAYSSTKSAKTLAKAKITGITSSDEEVLKISWKKVSGAKGYIISRSTKKDSGYSEIDTVSGERQHPTQMIL